MLKEVRELTPQIAETRLQLADIAENTPTNQPTINDERFRKLEKMIGRNTEISERILGKIDLISTQEV